MIKQVIVIRTDLKNTKGEKVRTGKLMAQVGHASMEFLRKRIKAIDFGACLTGIWHNAFLSLNEMEWLQDLHTKICLKVSSEQELIGIWFHAKDAGLEAHLIEDAGLTEFSEPTVTCLAIGPDDSEKIDQITKGLSLY